MKSIFTVQHTQSEHHTNGMVGSWTDWNLTELGMQQAERIATKLKQELDSKKGRFIHFRPETCKANG